MGNNNHVLDAFEQQNKNRYLIFVQYYWTEIEKYIGLRLSLKDIAKKIFDREKIKKYHYSSFSRAYEAIRKEKELKDEEIKTEKITNEEYLKILIDAFENKMKNRYLIFAEFFYKEIIEELEKKITLRDVGRKIFLKFKNENPRNDLQFVEASFFRAYEAIRKEKDKIKNPNFK